MCVIEDKKLLQKISECEDTGKKNLKKHREKKKKKHLKLTKETKGAKGQQINKKVAWTAQFFS